MKLQLVALAFAPVLLLAQGAAAEGAAAAHAGDRAAQAAWERTHRVSRIIDTAVRNRQGQKIGEIKDVVLDGNGHVAYAVVSTGGFLGAGDRLHAIPWAALQKEGDTNYFVLDMDRERLKNAPGFDARHWPDMASERWNTDTRNYYGTRR